MRLLPVALAALAFTTANDSTQLPQQIQNGLTTIDTVPTTAQLDNIVFAGDHQQALQSLAAIAGDIQADTGIRLRAIHALTKYCAFVLDTNGHPVCPDADPAHQALAALVVVNKDATSGANVVILRGAIEALGPLRVDTDLPLLLSLLESGSRDVRAATAHALRDLCNSQAITPLRQQQEHESADQVRLAITEALRVLGQPVCQ